MKKHNFKRIVAVVLSAIMCFGNLDVSALAAASDPVNAAPTTQIDHQGQTVEVTADSVKVLKTIKETGEENTFDITLDVYTQEQLSEIPSTADAAVVLVMDTSNSMTSKDGTTTNRLQKAQQAAKAFVKKFANTEGTDSRRMVAVVDFYSDASRKASWQNVATQSGLNTINSAINNLYIKGDIAQSYRKLDEIAKGYGKKV